MKLINYYSNNHVVSYSYQIVRLSDVTDDVERLCSLEKSAWGDMAATADEIMRRFSQFSDCYLGMMSDDVLVGSLMVVKTDLSRILERKWKDYLRKTKRTRSADRCLYVVSMTAADAAPRGVARIMLDYLEIEARARGCCATAFGSRIPGYFRFKHECSVREYVDRVLKNEVIDPVLSIVNIANFTVCGIVEEYFEDPASSNYGVIACKYL